LIVHKRGHELLRFKQHVERCVEAQSQSLIVCIDGRTEKLVFNPGSDLLGYNHLPYHATWSDVLGCLSLHHSANRTEILESRQKLAQDLGYHEVPILTEGPGCNKAKE
jgi:hypothetical protein